MKCLVGIYKITSPNNKVYIGQSVNIIERRSRYKNLHCKNQTKIYRSIKKYGWKKHKFEILELCEEDRLNELEVYYSDLYQSHDPVVGLNIRNCGGNKGKLSEETRKKISEANKGRRHTEETKAKIRAKRALQTFSEETRKKFSARFSGAKNPLFGKPLPEKMKENLRQLYLGKINEQAYSSKPIIQYDLEGNELKRWANARQVERELGYSFSCINRCCRGERKKSYNSIWKYANG